LMFCSFNATMHAQKHELSGHPIAKGRPKQNKS
jgi:hypothetical protein